MNCIFCQIGNGSVAAPKLYEDDQVYVIRDRSPQAPTHLLVIPKLHYGDLTSAADAPELLGRCLQVIPQVVNGLGVEAFRVVTNNGALAGQSVWHLHFHVLGGRALQGSFG